MSTVIADSQLVDQSAHTRWAWAGVLLTPVGVLLALGVGVLIGNLVGLLEGSEVVGPWQDAVPWYTGDDALKVALMVVPSWLLSLVAPAVGLWHGVRSSRSGSRSGKIAAAFAGVLLALLVGYGLMGLLLF
ncbi:MAG: hypothetical protein MUF09_09910 [Candidatus Nanopelagicales bacterium]|jgi:hypothetical protein|nr:hypothetical protein [Candidatus Nanopelagicales bacterium]